MKKLRLLLVLMAALLCLSACAPIYETRTRCTVIEINGEKTAALSRVYEHRTPGYPYQVPEEYKGLPVLIALPYSIVSISGEIDLGKIQSIESMAFYPGGIFDSVTLPEVRYIGHHAFYNNRIKSLYLSESIETIESGAFFLRDAVEVHFASAPAYLGEHFIEFTADLQPFVATVYGPADSYLPEYCARNGYDFVAEP